MTNNPNKPVVALDIDGTLGNYHSHFLSFATDWLGKMLDWNWNDKRGEFSEALGLDKETYRQIKLAYRQGGQKRTMPVFPGASDLVAAIREAGAEVWCCTTRPWQRLDNIDPDTREWFRRAGVEFDGVIYGEDKYLELANIVGKERVAAILDDEPEQYVAACRMFGNKVPILKFWIHNEWWREQSVWYAGVRTLPQAQKAILHKIDKWKEEHMPKPQACAQKDCSVPLPHTHGTDNPAVIHPTALDDYPAIGHPELGYVCRMYSTPDGPARFFEQQGTSFLYRCRELHDTNDHRFWNSEHTTGLSSDDDLPGQWSHSDFEGGDPDERSYAQRERDAAASEIPTENLRGDFGMPGLGMSAIQASDIVYPAKLQHDDAIVVNVQLPHDDVVVKFSPKSVTFEYGDGKGQQLDLTPQGYRILNILVHAMSVFAEKNADYGEPDGEDLGSRGQYADMHRKWKKLRRFLWDKSGDQPVGETIEEILLDFIGHCALTIDFLRRERS